MSSARHERLSRLFVEASRLDASAQAAYLETACPDDAALRDEVLDLLARDRASWPALEGNAPRPGPPDIPGFRVVGLLGRGGMGVVYEAEQDNPRRRVALKLLRPEAVSTALLKRFAHEAHVLAQLEHAAIARIYEVGRTKGDPAIPFFAMELVSGIAVTEAARRRELSARQRLELFARICDGVEYAHQKGVIHRDLKPGNILVTQDGDPKILDFGIARVTQSYVQGVTVETDVGQIVGTLPYMSPEQATGPSQGLDTRSDVYSLGVLLYQLLTGVLPHDLANRPLPEAIRIVSDVEPRSVGAVDPALRGDVATIVAKALAKDRDHRYQTAAELAADVRRYLRDEPIVARPTSTFYVLARLARRNKAVVAGLLAAVLAMVAGTVVSVVFALRAADARAIAQTESQESARQAKLADREARTSRRFVDFVLEALRGLDVNESLAGEPTLRHAMDGLSRRLEGDLADEPLIRARLHAFLGDIYRNLGHAEPAGEHLRRSVALYGDAKVENTDVAGALCASAWYLFKAGQLAEAERQLAEARRMLGGLGGEAASLAARCTTTEAEIALARREFGRAMTLIDEALAMQRRADPSEGGHESACLFVKGQIHLRSGNTAEAESRLRESLEMRRRLVGPSHPLVAESLQGVSEVRYVEGDFDGAEALLREAMAIREKTLPKNHPALASGFVNLGVLNHEREQYPTALECFDKAVAFYRTGYGAETTDMGTLLVHRAHALSALSRFKEAEASAREALAILRKNMDESHRNVILARIALGMLERRDGRLKEGVDTLLPAMTSIRSWPTEAAAEFQVARLETGALACDVGRLAEAEAVLSDALSEINRSGSDDPEFVRLTRAHLGRTLLGLGRPRDAEPHLLAAVELAKTIEPTPGARTRFCVDLLIQALVAMNEPERAETLRRMVSETRPKNP